MTYTINVYGNAYKLVTMDLCRECDKVGGFMEHVRNFAGENFACIHSIAENELEPVKAFVRAVFNGYAWDVWAEDEDGNECKRIESHNENTTNVTETTNGTITINLYSADASTTGTPSGSITINLYNWYTEIARINDLKKLAKMAQESDRRSGTNCINDWVDFLTEEHAKAKEFAGFVKSDSASSEKAKKSAEKAVQKAEKLLAIIHEYTEPETAEPKEEEKTMKENTIIKFEVGKLYSCICIGNSDIHYFFRVISRTEKTVTISDVYGSREENQRKKRISFRTIHKANGESVEVEYILPQGSYSMAPLLDATEIITEEPEESPTMPTEAAEPITEEHTPAEPQKAAETPTETENKEDNTMNALYCFITAAMMAIIAACLKKADYVTARRISGGSRPVWTDSPDWEELEPGDLIDQSEPEETAPTEPAPDIVVTGSSWTGRADYEERKAAKIERLEAAADKADKNAEKLQAAFNAHRGDIAYLTQPIHNTAGGRAFARQREREVTAYERGFDEMERAEKLRESATRLGNNTAISSDDPAALVKLREKLEAMEARQTMMKAVNRYYKKHETLDDCPDLTPEMRNTIEKYWARGWYVGIPFPAYELQNNNQNMKRVKDRIAELENMPHFEGWEFDGGRVEINTDENRVQVYFDEIPAEETRAALKKHGFKWSRANKSWQRMLNKAAYYAAQSIQAIKPETVTA